MTIPGAGGQTPPRPDQQAAAAANQPIPVAPGSTNVVRARQVIIVGDSGQVLVYSPTQALGNLVSSISASPFTDPKGNAVLGGIVSYSGSGSVWQAAALVGESSFGAGVVYYAATSAGGPWTREASITYLDGELSVQGNTFVVNTATAQLNNGGVTIPFNPGTLTTVAQVQAALVNAGIFT